MQFDKIRAIAKQVRSGYEQYPLHKDLLGYCAIVSAELFRQLKAEGIDSVICMNEEPYECHVFLIVDDHIVDATASQFQEFEDEIVVIMHEKEAASYSFYDTDVRFSNVKNLILHQKKNNWPISQIAH